MNVYVVVGRESDATGGYVSLDVYAELKDAVKDITTKMNALENGYVTIVETDYDVIDGEKVLAYFRDNEGYERFIREEKVQ